MLQDLFEFVKQQDDMLPRIFKLFDGFADWRAEMIARTELNAELIDPLYLAAVESVEEAVVNALVAGEDVPTVKPKGQVIPALDTARLRAIRHWLRQLCADQADRLNPC